MSVRHTPERDGVRLAYETSGSPADPPLLLVAGLGGQLISWHAELGAALVDSGFWVVRFDNRDIGLSTHLHDAPAADVDAAVRRGDTSSASYDLADMADDIGALLDHLGIAAAHVVGVSMGGMIAQTLAIRQPQRLLTLTTIMSTPSPHLGAPTREAAAALRAPAVTTRAAAVEQGLAGARVIGSPAYPLDETWLRWVVGESYDRSYDPPGVARQLLAIHTSGDRSGELRRVQVPTLVIHGDADPLVQLEGGRATAAAIPGAELLVIAGMGHDLPREVWPQLIGTVSAHAGLRSLP